ncbi:hypothetical protein CXF68_15270 [Tenacibaculum sp. Bg11-29]|uniref:hypothetical protein n=1 Tax=Tenacibaculum sp. Bg11-29 TaxID=2058306 RepID=UPI000C3350A9|nr:hypothetical protein [Tenacibaculum sp. Bg11-29]PKH51967.1 hypothetical protein CXF68_15270 [Tenacibaculum sp. Bg11-29]
MKKILLLILLFYSFLGFGQEYGVWFSTLINNSRYESFNIRNVNEFTIKYLRQGRGEEAIIGGRVRRGESYNVSEVVKVESERMPVQIKIFRYEYNSSTEICRYDSGSNGSIPELKKYQYYGAYQKSRYLCDGIEIIRSRSKEKKSTCFGIMLPYYTQPDDNLRSRKDLLFKTQENIFLDAIVQVPEIVWEYNYDNKGFKHFPESIKHNFPMKSTVGEILIKENIQVGKPLKIKVRTDKSNLFSKVVSIGGKEIIRFFPELSLGIMSFNILAASPELSSIKPVKTTCNYSINGGFTLNLKRDLYTSEKETLVMTLYYDNNVLINQEFTSSKLTDNKDGTFGYTWKKLLDAGNYKVKFQTHKKKEGIDKDDPSWSSLIPADFVITKANKVKFSITNTSDETCFEKNNGYINIKAEGEGERTFLYQLTKEQVVQFYNGTSWVDYSGTKVDEKTWFPFISKNNTKIGNLAKGNYRVKVKDSKSCFAR